ncbi:MAG: TIGR02996 domain-containing protein, partial [Deltaproteobacteria bacterium]|nr:TIGR02996 domain-containing protein [Deltaproteobacteria bacterium]
MGSALAIVSKAVFEKLAGGAQPGAVLALDQYASTHKSLETLAGGGTLFLVTVRPPDEQLWLVAALEEPERGAAGWSAAANRAPIADISRLRSKLEFSTGAGIQAKPGALGMSLQTPRALTEGDVALLRGATGATSVRAAKAAKPAKPTKAAKAVAPAAGATDLTALQSAFAAKDGAAALSAALAWWRVQRAPALADLIEAISTRVSGTAVADDVEFATLARAKNPLDLGRLLPAVRDLPVSFLPMAAKLMNEYPDDPRIAKAVAEWAVVPITTSSSKYAFWTTMFAATTRIGDTRVIPILKKRLAGTARRNEVGTVSARIDAAIEKVIARLPAAPPFDAKLTTLVAGVAKLSPIATVSNVRAAEPVVKLTGAWLAQAATHLKSGRVGGAIAALLERWRETRVPALADLIDRTTRLLPTHDLPLASVQQLHAAWMNAFEADPQGAMPQLLQNVNRGDTKLREIRIAKLATLPDDPRISLRLTELAPGAASSTAGSFWKRLFEAIAKARDVRTCAPLRREFRDFTNTYFYHHATGRRIVSKFAIHPETAFDTWPLELAAEDHEPVARFEAALTTAEAAATKRERALLAAIAEDLADDGARLVYADWLLERNHPRGELIILSCKTKPTEAETVRLEELVDVPYLHGTLDDFGMNPRETDRGIVRNLA